MKVLSLFDGISCGYEALLEAGIPIEKYYASEIDKYAIKVATTNHPDIIEIGDVCNVKGEDYQDIDLVIGGFCCQSFSLAGKQKAFDDPRGQLFFEFVRIIKEVKPKYFLGENVKMKKEYEEVINKELRGITPTMIDSALLTAQRRKRNYWVGELQEDGTYKKVDIPQPEDKGITLKDILLEEVDEKYILTQKQIDMIANWKGYEKPLERVKGVEDKMDTLTTHCGKMSNGIKLVSVPCTTHTLRVCQPNSVIESVEPPKIRKLHPIECERLQGLRDGYTGVEGIGNSQRYKQLGNGWTVPVIAHIFKHLIKQNG